MSDKKHQISMNLSEQSLERLDSLCRKLDMTRPAVLRMIFSTNPKSVMLIFNTLMGDIEELAELKKTLENDRD